mgnify:CR=1 FL=1
MDFETRNDVTESEYMYMIRLKTSVLLGCACAVGAVLADASAPVFTTHFSDIQTVIYSLYTRHFVIRTFSVQRLDLGTLTHIRSVKSRYKKESSSDRKS